MKFITRSITGLALAAALAACADPAGIRSPKAGLAPSASQLPTTSVDGRITTAPPGPIGITTPWAMPLGLNATKIYGSLGEGSNVYNPNVAWTVAGHASSAGISQELAHSFVPNADYTVAGIALALTHAGGSNIYRVSLHADNAGLPGTVIRTWTLANLGGFGSCCVTAVVRNWSVLPVAQGVRYWVVASSGSPSAWGAGIGTPGERTRPLLTGSTTVPGWRPLPTRRALLQSMGG